MAMTKNEFARKQFFNGDYVTFIVVGGNTFEAKDEIKTAGFKFTKELGWHASEPITPPEGFELLEMTFDECFTNEFELREEAREKIKKLTRNSKESHLNAVAACYENSKHIGEIGERLKNITVKYLKRQETESMYGLGYRILFDYCGNILVWFTSSCAIEDFEEGDTILFSGTIKDHKHYNNIDQTVMSRCNLKPIA